MGWLFLFLFLELDYSRLNIGGARGSELRRSITFKPLRSGYFKDQKHTAIMYINFNDRTVDLNFTFSHSPHLKADKAYSVRDLWKHEEKGIFRNFFFDGSIPTHDVKAYIFTEQAWKE